MGVDAFEAEAFEADGVSVAVVHGPSSPVVTVAGELDVSNVAVLRDAIAMSRRGQPAGRQVVVDLADVTFMDSSAIGVLIEAAEGGLVLHRPSRAVRLVVAATGLSDALGCEP